MKWTILSALSGADLIYLCDATTGDRFLVDTGASCSVFPSTSSNLVHGPPLRSTSSQAIATAAPAMPTVHFGHRGYRFPFVPAAVVSPILGFDFLARFKLLVNPLRRRVLDAFSLQPINALALPSRPSPLIAALTTTPPHFRALFTEFPSVFAPPALEGRRFRILTDHKPLFAALHCVSPPWSARQQRQLSYISEFTTDIRHTAGIDNVVANALSRPPSPLSTASSSPASGDEDDDIVAAITTAPLSVPAASPLSYHQMAQLQSTCPSIPPLLDLPSLQLATVPVQNLLLHGDVSTGTFRPLVPTALRRSVFALLHNVSHPGCRATRRLISSRFVWKSLAKDVTAWSRECLSCQRSKVHRHVHLRASPIPIPDRRFAHIHVDLVGPLPPSQGYTHIFTIIDRSTRWVEAVPLDETTAAACATALFTAWITRFGVPSHITSDRGPQFTSSLWSSLTALFNITHITTTAYHPAANGMVERVHRRLKDALRARATTPSWSSQLPWVLLGLRTTPRDDDSSTPAEAVYGTHLVLPGQFLPAAPSTADSTDIPPPAFFDNLLYG